MKTSCPLVCGFGLIVSLISGCNSPGPACSVAQWPNIDDDACRDAIVLAARESTTAAVQDEDVAAVLEFLFALKSPACIPDDLMVFPRHGDLITVSVDSTHPPIMDAWGNGEVHTGDVDVDAVFEGNGAVSVVASPSGGFVVEFDRAIAVMPLADAAATIPETTVSTDARDDLNLPDIARGSVDGGWTVNAVAGWGDCVAGCISTHAWKLFVSSDLLTVRVDEESGDPLPDVEGGNSCL